jgi:ADP-heptose:LPS heptosyltransferase
MIKALHRHFQQAAIDVLAETRNAGIYQMSQEVSKVHCYDRRPLVVFRRLRRIHYHVIVDTEQFHHLSVVVANMLRPMYLCGFGTLGRSRFQTHTVAYSDDTYEAQSFLHLAQALTGWPARFDPDEPFIDVPSQDRAWAESTFAFLGQRALVTIMPGAMSPYRVWPKERYGQVVEWLIERGFYVVIIGGKDVAHMSHIMAGRYNQTDVLDLTGRTTWAQSAALIQRARVYLSADTGSLHMAYGVGTPTVSLFGSGNYSKWAPPGKYHVMVRKGLSCSPCTRLGFTPRCPNGMQCMAAISVGDVITALKEVLGK